MAESIPQLEPGDSRTGYAPLGVTGARFLAITGTRADGLPTVGHAAGPTVPVIGVSAHDALAGGTVGIHRGKTIEVPVEAGADLVAGTEVTSDAVGRAVPIAAGNRGQGVCLADTANGALAPIDRAAR